MSMIRCVNTGLIYQNPKPHVRSIQAYFPSVVTLTNGEMLATVAFGEAFEAANLQTHLFRSKDQGETWTLQGPLCPKPANRITSECSRLTSLANGELVVFMMRHDRTDYPEEGLTNPQTLGFVPTELLILRSTDFGHTWTSPQTLVPPLVGPAFELCCPIIPLRNGRWLLPTSTWPGWSGDCPNGLRMIALESSDRGKTWPVYHNVMQEPDQQVFFWESKIVELKDNRLLVIAWVYDQKTAKDRPNHYAISNDGGKNWSAPQSTGLQGQTLAPCVLNDGRILSIYRRMDQPGLWANVSHLQNDQWINDGELPLWGHQAAGLTSTSQNMSQNFNVLKFGAPSITRLGDGTIFVAFWCYEAGTSVIRWFKLNISEK